MEGFALKDCKPKVNPHLKERKDYKPELSPRLKVLLEEGIKKNQELLSRLVD